MLSIHRVHSSAFAGVLGALAVVLPAVATAQEEGAAPVGGDTDRWTLSASAALAFVALSVDEGFGDDDSSPAGGGGVQLQLRADAPGPWFVTANLLFAGVQADGEEREAPTTVTITGMTAVVNEPETEGFTFFMPTGGVGYRLEPFGETSRLGIEPELRVGAILGDDIDAGVVVSPVVGFRWRGERVGWFGEFGFLFTNAEVETGTLRGDIEFGAVLAGGVELRF